jgi:hypothetical protein
MAKKKTEELDIITGTMPLVDQSAPMEGVPEASPAADMDLNELLESLDAPDKSEIPEAVDGGPQSPDGAPPNNAPVDTELSESIPAADALAEKLSDDRRTC